MMMIGRDGFTFCRLLLCAALLACGCTSTQKERDEKKEKEDPISTLRIHLETPSSPMDFTVRVSVNREPPVMVTVDKQPFLTEADVAGAKLVEVMGGFDLQIEFDHHGSLLLEQYSTSNPGRRFAIFSQFGNQPGESRWLAAPVISRRITGGTMTFTPDASRAETERAILGLNNVAKKNKERNKW